jgi:predicted RNase H-like HicB family nuclease
LRGAERLPQFFKEEDLYVAECPEVGTVSQGYSVEEAVANLREATELYLEEFPLPEITRYSETGSSHA